MQAQNQNHFGSNVSVDKSANIFQSWLEHVTVGANCKLIRCTIRGTAEDPITIEDGCDLIGCHVISSNPKAQFRFASWQSQAVKTHLSKRVKLDHCHIENSSIGSDTIGTRATVRNSTTGSKVQLRPHSSLLLSSIASHAHLGSEVSKSVIQGEGFVSEHTASYLSLVAPADYPILDSNGQEQILTGLPNLTNIGAGTVFANYSGKPKPAQDLLKSSGSLKGTSILYGAFTAVNSTIVNRYGQPDPKQSIFDLFRRKDITILGLGSFVEQKVTGRIPAFSYSSQTSAKQIKIGWVLEKHPGILLNIIKKMQKQLGDQTGKLRQLVEGTLRFEIQLLQEALESKNSLFEKDQLEKGLKIFQKHLKQGWWAMDEKGQFKKCWGYHETEQNWRAT